MTAAPQPAQLAAEPTVHRCPPMGEGRTPCCGRTVFELPTTDQLALSDGAVTCHPEPEPDTPADEILARLNEALAETARTTQAWGIRFHRDGRTYGIKVMDITNLDRFDGRSIDPLRRLPITMPAEIAADLPTRSWSPCGNPECQCNGEVTP